MSEIAFYGCRVKSDSEALRRNRISDVDLGAIAIYNKNIAIVNVTRIKKMDVTQLSNKTIELSDITAWDKNGNKLLVSKVRARNIVEDITAKLQSRGITMIDLVAMITGRKSTKIAKHTNRFINAFENIIEIAMEDCDREAKEAKEVLQRSQQQHGPLVQIAE